MVGLQLQYKHGNYIINTLHLWLVFIFFNGYMSCRKPDTLVPVAWPMFTAQIGTLNVGCKAESWRADVVMSLCLHVNLLLCSAQQHCPPAPSSLPTLVPPGRLRYLHHTFIWRPQCWWRWSYSSPSLSTSSLGWPNPPPSCCLFLLSLIWPFSTPELYLNLSL